MALAKLGGNMCGYKDGNLCLECVVVRQRKSWLLVTFIP